MVDGVEDLSRLPVLFDKIRNAENVFRVLVRLGPQSLLQQVWQSGERGGAAMQIKAQDDIFGRALVNESVQQSVRKVDGAIRPPEGPVGPKKHVRYTHGAAGGGQAIKQGLRGQIPPLRAEMLIEEYGAGGQILGVYGFTRIVEAQDEAVKGAEGRRSPKQERQFLALAVGVHEAEFFVHIGRI